MITYQDVKCVGDDPTLDGIVRVSELDLPELNVIPQITGPGDAYEFWRRTQKIDEPIFVGYAEGVCAAKAKWAKERRELSYTLRVMESSRGAVLAGSSGVRQVLPVWEQTRVEELANYRRRLVKSLYVSEGANAGYTLDDFSVVRINALSKEWNGTENLVVDPEAPTAGEITALGGLTTAYLVYASEAGLHYRWGNDRMLSFLPEEFKQIRDDDKSTATGKECTYPGIVQFFDGTVSAVAKSEFDVVKIVNVPQGLDPNGKKFLFDTLIGRIIPLLYQGAMVRPNVLLVPSLVVSNWWVTRAKEGVESGGVDFRTLPNAPEGFQIPVISEYELAVARSSTIPFGVAAETGNVTTTNLYDSVGDLQVA